MLFTARDVAEVRHVVQRILVPCVFVIGLLGNSVSIYVLTRRRMRCTTNIYLTALAITDLIYLTMALLLSLQHYQYVHQCCQLYWLFYGVVLWLCDACERFIAIRYPLKRQTFCTESLAKRVITGVAVFCLLSTISTAFEHEYSIEFKMIDSRGQACNHTKKSVSLINPLHTPLPSDIVQEFQIDGSGNNDFMVTTANVPSIEVPEFVRANHFEMLRSMPQRESVNEVTEAGEEALRTAVTIQQTSLISTNIPQLNLSTNTLENFPQLMDTEYLTSRNSNRISPSSSSSSYSQLLAPIVPVPVTVPLPVPVPVPVNAAKSSDTSPIQMPEYKHNNNKNSNSNSNNKNNNSDKTNESQRFQAAQVENYALGLQSSSYIFNNVTEYCQNITYYEHISSALGNNEIYLKIWNFFTLLVFVLIPLCMLLTFNCFLIMLVRKSKTVRGEMTNASSMRRPKRKMNISSVSQENRVTVTLIAVVLLFIVCQLPWAIYLIVSEQMEIDINLRIIIGNIFNFLAALNAAANFFLYCVLSDKYRKTVRELITGYRYQHQRHTLHSSSLLQNGSRRSYRPGQASSVIIK
uniref:G-protein coupled receptors family 1 profile domain-containing protein n=1 Tax=Glossina brevipalpis TaxID=37001 RepID=A0A1A9W284_9MUSC